ncbi:GNAT family N-acetyltransferase, partial [Vibrio cholerae]|uniref:GNAT family N-acetyltransferase n=1 Tax=Vibrio cholerae TaxID=666 RepID=UPI00053C5E9F
MINIYMDSTPETLEQLYIAGLFEENFIEADPRSTKSNFELNLESCYNLLAADMMKIIVVKDEDTPVGYVIYTIVPQDLFTKECVASTVCLYLKPKYRGGTVFKRMIEFAETSAHMYGATVLHIGLTPTTASLERFGYHVDNIVYSKLLEG